MRDSHAVFDVRVNIESFYYWREPAHRQDEIRLGPPPDDVAFCSSCPDPARYDCCKPVGFSTVHGVVFAILCLGPAVHRPQRVEDARERAGGGADP
jgi:hypothetical protein